MITEPDPMFPYPTIDLIVTIDLESGQYWAGSDVLARLHAQTRHIPNGCVAEVRFGRQALRVRPADLEHQIAAALCLTAKHIDIRVPAGVPGVDWLRANLQRHVRELREDHTRMLAEQRHPG